MFFVDVFVSIAEIFNSKIIESTFLFCTAKCLNETYTISFFSKGTQDYFLYVKAKHTDTYTHVRAHTHNKLHICLICVYGIINIVVFDLETKGNITKCKI